MDEDEKKMLFNEINILRNLVSLVSSRSTAQHNLTWREMSREAPFFLFKYYILTLRVMAVSSAVITLLPYFEKFVI